MIPPRNIPPSNRLGAASGSFDVSSAGTSPVPLDHLHPPHARRSPAWTGKHLLLGEKMRAAKYTKRRASTTQRQSGFLCECPHRPAQISRLVQRSSGMLTKAYLGSAMENSPPPPFCRYTTFVINKRGEGLHPSKHASILEALMRA